MPLPSYVTEQLSPRRPAWHERMSESNQNSPIEAGGTILPKCETIIESENEVLELMGRVDEGVEEFFTKKVLPTETQNKQDEETITLQEVAPASSVPCPPPTKTLRRKLGDFFTLKKKRGLKSEPSQEGRPKKASIADLIRPLREVARSEKDKDRVKEHDKENEKEKAKPHLGAVPGDPAVQEPPVGSDAPLRGEAAPPRRALREGKSQSLILLSGSAAAGTTNGRNTAKKPLEGQHSFEQKLHLMLQRIGVSKPQPGDTQNQEKEMKKAESEGTIIDSKPEPPSTFSKPRTMSASSDTRHQIRVSVSAHEAAGKPALLPKPVLKPGPPPTTSGRNTPENELAQIQEAETNTPTKLSPTTVPSAPAAPDPAAATTSTVPTISDSVPDAASVTVSPSSTVDTEICTTEAATTPTDDAVSENKASVPKTTDTTFEAATTSSESVTKTPSVATLETASDPSKQSPVSTTPTDLSVKATLPELNGVLAKDAEGDADVSVTAAAPSSPTSTLDPGLTGPEAGETTPAASSASETSVSKTTCPPSIPDDTITVSVSQEEVPVPTSSTIVSASLPPTTSSSSTTSVTITPSSCDHMSSVSAPSNIQAALLSPDEIPAPSTSSSDTNPTDTTSTATSLNHADTTSTSSPAISAAISSSTVLDPVSKVTPSGNKSGAAPHLLTSPPPSNDSPCQDHDLQTSCEEEAKVEKAEKPSKVEDKELDMIKNIESTEPEKKKETVLKETKSENDKPALDKSDLPRKEVQKESVKTEDDTMSEPGKEGEQSRDDVISEPQEQEATL
ncbi:cell wall protein DAN4 isoform X2 [Austrofundulus limnaeus]|uniref:Cell wall protein DAN4 isoform X2 n=1 Tax=Austrofundulus limnaeus TaxID=52670 RepID=A0A2I4CTL1_AUSLI|nr:PREDICTED: cell wall protein DAN4-like isoform X2 [Austrofundulus limnaeus]